ncbi:MAG: flagellar biosynthesis anti-sigma factor FlgM [Haliea sp.]
MSDSINGLGKPGGPLPSRPASAPASGNGPAPSTAAGGDSVNLTDTARQLQELTRVAASSESVDPERVAAVRQALADGQYAIDSRQIAERLLQFDN